MKRTLSVVFGVSCVLFAGEELRQKIQVVHTEHADFPAGGLLTLKNSMGDLTIEGWDRPDVEITTIKSTKAAYAAQDRERVSRELDKVRRVGGAPERGTGDHDGLSAAPQPAARLVVAG